MRRRARELWCRVFGHLDKKTPDQPTVTVAMELDPVGAPGEFTKIADVELISTCRRCGRVNLKLP